jgi:26S proteasome regulatory subunit N13
MAPDAAAAVRNFLNSLNPGGKGGQQSTEGKAYPLLSDLLEAPTTVPMVRAAEEGYIDSLLHFLPASVLVLAQQGEDSMGAPDVEGEPGPESAAAAIAAMTLGQKRALLEKVLRSPQFHQSLASLTMALRDGGLPSIAEALGVKVENGGYMRGGSMPLGGGEAVEAFVEGVKKSVQEK